MKGSQILRTVIDKLTGALNGSSDIVLAFFVITIILMIIIPVPPPVIDTFIAINLGVSVGLLMVSLYIAKAVQLSIFPSILLITTLFRLGIEISATRQILLHADAGHIIAAFGNFVVGGSFVVGGIIFLIITIVQFIVVTKGAERVAEVAARFTLDAMPGKQMSIDADMRSGVIDANQARQLRLALQKESQLYGAMDGAMKFVKGDVIAGIVIAVINIVGGLLIGIMMHNMSAMQAAKTYTLLSVGGGLVSQIPSLLISLTAGIVTTRVSSEKKDANLGKDISTQLLAQPKGLLLAAAVVFGMTFMKGFPQIPFILLGLTFAGGGIMMLLRQKRKAKATGGEREAEGEGEASGEERDGFALTMPVVLEAGKNLSELIKKDRTSGSFIETMIPKMRQALYQDLGVLFPGVHVRTDAPLDPDEYVILLNEVPIVRGRVIPGAVLTSESEETLKRFNLPYTKSKNAIGSASLWVDIKYKEILSKAGIKYWDALNVMILHLSYFLRTNADEFLGIQEVRSLVEFTEKNFPDLVKEVTRLVPLQKMTEIFRRLVEEQVSIRDLRSIMEALAEWAQSEKDTVILTDYVRSSLKRYISYKYSLGQSTLAAYLLDPEIEDMIRGAIKQTSAGSYLALDPDTIQLILHSLRTTVSPTPPGGQPPVLIATFDVRRHVRKLIEAEFPDMPVISYQEIVPEIRIQPLGRIQLS